ncbi:uncharacterized protein [Diadema setosum]|uniref:uncharacterized protein n=1 Tax=Diadema setosum TaxID=31175 RepID=UPI003B3AFD1C
MAAHMRRMKQDTSSSSEDEAESERLSSAIWNHDSFSQNGQAQQKSTLLSSGQNACVKTKTVVTDKPSIRKQIAEDYHDQFNEDHKNVIATPEMRSFVAKKLSSFLDKSFETVDPKETMRSVQIGTTLQDHYDDVFKLLSTSCCAPDTSSPPPAVRQKRPYIGRKRRRKLSAEDPEDSSDSEVENKRLAEAAISGEQILITSVRLAEISGERTAQVNGSHSSEETDSVGDSEHGSDHTHRKRGAPEIEQNGSIIRDRGKSEVVDKSFSNEAEHSQAQQAKKMKKKKKKRKEVKGQERLSCDSGEMADAERRESLEAQNKLKVVTMINGESITNTINRKKKKAKKSKPGSECNEILMEDSEKTDIFHTATDSQEVIVKKRKKKKKCKNRIET